MFRYFSLLLLLFATPASATITAVVSSSITATAGTTSNVTTPAVNTTGATLMVVMLYDFQGTLSGTLTDNQSNTWTLAGGATYTDGASCRLRCYFCVNPTTNASHTLNYTSAAASYPTIIMKAYAGTTTRDQQAGTGLASASSGQPGSITPAQDSALVVTAACVAAGSAPTVSSPYSVVGSAGFVNLQRFASIYADNIQTARTATNPTITYGASAVSAIMIVSFNNNVPAATTTRGGGLMWFNSMR